MNRCWLTFVLVMQVKRCNAIRTQLAEKHFNKHAYIIQKAQHFCPEAMNDLFISFCHCTSRVCIKTVIAERIGSLLRVIYYTGSVINNFFKCTICLKCLTLIYTLTGDASRLISSVVSYFREIFIKLLIMSQ